MYVNTKYLCAMKCISVFRGINILPNRVLGLIGRHKYPVEHISVTHCKKYAVSSSHERRFRFWNIEKLSKNKKPKTGSSLNKATEKRNFFSDMLETDIASKQKEEGSSSADDSDVDSEEEEEDMDE